MRLALQTDYCLRLLMYLAGDEGRSTIQEIAEFFEISKDHLAKAAQRLARLGYVRSIRGIGGGLELARAAEEISIGDVLKDVEGNVHLLECVGATQKICVIQPGCKLRSVLAEAERLQMDYLQSVRLSDVVRPGRQLVSLTKES